MARSLALLATALALVPAGCGEQRQDANAPSGEFALEVTSASFPAEQRIAEPVTLRLEVANRGERTVPNLAVTVETAARAGQAPRAFALARDDPALADSGRPVWILDEGPAGGDSAYSNTWAVGPLGAGRTSTVAWKLTATQRGRLRSPGGSHPRWWAMSSWPRAARAGSSR